MSQGYRLDTFWREADEITSYLRRATQLVGELICHIGGGGGGGGGGVGACLGQYGIMV